MGERPDDDLGPYAAGVHLRWSDAPEAIHRWVDEALGSPAVAVRDVVGGFSPGCCTVLTLENGRSVFVKAVGAALNPVSPDMHRREGRVAAALPRSRQLPELIHCYDDGDWVALVYREIVGSLPRHPWVDQELDVVLEGLTSLHEVLTPCPIHDLEPTSLVGGGTFSGWRSLAALTERPERLDDWSWRHLDRLAELEVRCAHAVDEGETLVHGDVRSDNVLLRAGDGAVFIDWPHASRGAPVIDLVGWAPSVALEGGPDPEALLGRYRPAREWDDDATTAVVAGVAGYFTAHALLPEPPGLSNLRRFQDAQGVVSRSWLSRRTGWR